MSEPLIITPFITYDAVLRATAAKNEGFTLQGKYLEVGRGFQEITLDENGHALIDSLAEPLSFMTFLNAESQENSWNMVVDLVDIKDGNGERFAWDFTEFRLCDSDKNTIAIFGSLGTIQPININITNALLQVHLSLSAMPLNSIIIEHRNLPLNLFVDDELTELATVSIKQGINQMDMDMRLRKQELK